MKSLILFVLLAYHTNALAPLLIYPECNDGDPDTMDFCGGTISDPIWCNDDYRDPGAHNSTGNSIPGSCLNFPRPFRSDGVTPNTPGTCYTALGWFGDQNPVAFTAPFSIADYPLPEAGGRFLNNDINPSLDPNIDKQDAGGSGGYVWKSGNVLNSVSDPCPPAIPSAILPPAGNSHSVSFDDNYPPVNGCGFKHGLPLDTIKNMGMLVTVRYYPFTEYVVRVYYSPTDLPNPISPASLTYLGCIDYSSPSGGNCTSKGFDVVNRNSLSIFKPNATGGIIQINLVKNSPLGLGSNPRGEIWFIFDAISTPTQQPSISDVMFMYLNLYWATNDCRTNMQCMTVENNFPSKLTQATDFSTAVMPASLTNPCNYGGDPCSASVCDGEDGMCKNYGFADALDNAPVCSGCAIGQFNAGNVGCLMSAFSIDNTNVIAFGATPAYRSRFKNDWDSFGRLPSCTEKIIEYGDDTFMNGGRISQGVMQWQWYSGMSVNVLDTQYMNGLGVARTFPLDPSLYPDGAALVLEYLSHCASFIITVSNSMVTNVPIFCSDTISVTPGSNDFSVVCNSNTGNSYTVTSSPANGIVLNLSTFVDTSMSIKIQVDNNVANIFGAAPACASVTNPFVQLINMAVVPSNMFCEINANCQTSGRCKAETCVSDDPICPPMGCSAPGTCVSNTCQYTNTPNNANCNDNNVCTTDTCNGNTCSHASISCPPPVVCQINNGCDAELGCLYTQAPDGTLCPAGVCDSGNCNLLSGCSSNSDCQSQADDCTSATCVMGNCQYAPIAGACQDNNMCLTGGMCQPGSGTRGVCVSSSHVMCDAMSDLPSNKIPCLRDYVCNPMTGNCVAQYYVAGSVCNDNDACTVDDVCDNTGTCAGQPLQCTNIASCTSYMCSAGQCVGVVVADGTNCPITYEQNCGSMGTCVQVQSDLSICEVTLTFPCMFPPVTVDELPCVSHMTCHTDMGGCTTKLFFVDDGSPCTIPGTLCTDNGICQNNVCVEQPVDCSSSEDQCTSSACDANTGKCENTPLIGDPCTLSNQCFMDPTCHRDYHNVDKAVCFSTTLITCPAPPITLPSGQCFGNYLCHPQTGLCGINLVPDGTVCNDGFACTNSDECHSGLCYGSQINCNIPGTLGMCNVGQGPSFTCDNGACVSIQNPGPFSCNDNIFCNGPEVIFPSGVCGSNTTVLQTCPPVNDCTTCYCNELAMTYSTIIFNPIVGTKCQNPSNGPCGQGRWQCVSGIITCVNQYTPVAEICGNGIDDNCDGNVDEGCNMHTMCSPTQLPCVNIACHVSQCQEGPSPFPPGYLYRDDDDDDNDEFDDDDDDGPWLNVNPFNDPWIGPHGGMYFCNYTALPAGSSCSMNDLCFTNYMCNAIGTCVGTPINCDDSNPSTIDTCVAGGCHHQQGNKTPCNDGNICSVNDHYDSFLNRCIGFNLTCVTCNQCSEVTCGGGGCGVVASSSSKPCDDNDACTTNDLCNGSGGCVGTPIDCDTVITDLPMCGVAYCDNGCQSVVVPNGGPCDLDIQALQAIEGDSTSRCLNGTCHVSTPVNTDLVSPGCGGTLLQCTTPDECRQWMSDFMDIVAELSLRVAACSHKVYHGTTHSLLNNIFSLNDTSTVVLIVNETYAVNTVKQWIELAHKEHAMFRSCDDYGDCETFLSGVRRLRAIYDIYQGLITYFTCPSIEDLGIDAVIRKPNDASWNMNMAWDDSIDMSVMSDYDLNDLVVAWHVTEGLDTQGRSVLSEIRYEIIARGSLFNHALRWMVRGIPCSPTTLTYSQLNGFAGTFAQVAAYKWYYDPALGTLNSTMISAFNGCGITVFPNTMVAMPPFDNTTKFANTVPSLPKVLPAFNVHMVASVNYGNKPIDVANETIDHFEFLSRYYHALDVSGKGDVASFLVKLNGTGSPTILNPIDSVRLNVPMMQNLPCGWKWPVEDVSIIDAYPNFTMYQQWLIMGGVPPFPPWYTNPANSSVVYS